MTSRPQESVSLNALELISSQSLEFVFLPYDRGSSSVMRANWLKTFEFDVVIGHYYPVMPAHYITNQPRI